MELAHLYLEFEDRDNLLPSWHLPSCHFDLLICLELRWHWSSFLLCWNYCQRHWFAADADSHHFHPFSLLILKPVVVIIKVVIGHPVGKEV